MGDRCGGRTRVPGRQWTGRCGSRAPGARGRESREHSVQCEPRGLQGHAPAGDVRAYEVSLVCLCQVLSQHGGVHGGPSLGPPGLDAGGPHESGCVQ